MTQSSVIDDDDARMSLLDINVLVDDIARKRYACGKCGKLAVNAQGLDCNSKYHQTNLTTLYCKQCSTLIMNDNNCPFNNHQFPQFFDAKTPQKEILNLNVLCINSTKYITSKQNNGLHVEDTSNNDIEGHNNDIDDEKNHNKPIQNPSSCQWMGKYMNLNAHIKQCPFNTIKCSFNGCNDKNILSITTDDHNKKEYIKHLNLINNDIKLINNIQNKLNKQQEINKNINEKHADLQKRFEEFQIKSIQQNQELIQLNEKFSDSMQNMKQINDNKVKLIPQNTELNLNKSQKIINILIIVMVILFAIIFYGLYRDNQNDNILSLNNLRKQQDQHIKWISGNNSIINQLINTVNDIKIEQNIVERNEQCLFSNLTPNDIQFIYGNITKINQKQQEIINIINNLNVNVNITNDINDTPDSVVDHYNLYAFVVVVKNGLYYIVKCGLIGGLWLCHFVLYTPGARVPKQDRLLVGAATVFISVCLQIFYFPTHNLLEWVIVFTLISISLLIGYLTIQYKGIMKNFEDAVLHFFLLHCEVYVLFWKIFYGDDIVVVCCIVMLELFLLWAVSDSHTIKSKYVYAHSALFVVIYLYFYKT